MRSLALLGLMLAACTPSSADPEIRTSVLSSIGEVLHPSEVYVRFLAAEETLVVYDRLGGAELVRGPVTTGAKYSITLSGHPCELESRGVTNDVETVVNAKSNEELNARTPTTTRERRTTSLHVTLRCSDGPVPGITSNAGVVATMASTWLMSLVLIGVVIGGLWWLGDEKAVMQLVSVLLALGTIGATFVFGWRAATGLLALTLPLLGVSLGALCAFAALLFFNNDDTKSRVGAVVIVAGAAAAPGLIAAKYPQWDFGAPLAAIGVAFVISLVGAYLATRD